MKSLQTTLVTLCLLAPVAAQTASAIGAKPVQATNTIMDNSPTIHITRNGFGPSQPAPAEYFTGTARVFPLPPSKEPSRLGGATVVFEAGARTNWHTHPMGQTLMVTQGVGRVQSFGGPIQEMRVGDMVQIAPGVKHWHGAAPNSAMSHVALAESQNGVPVDWLGRSRRLALVLPPQNGVPVDWLEPVSDEQYGAPLAGPGAATSNAQPSRAQQLMGDIAPKLAQLTDDVLFGDIWERPQLSKRDRSLATVSALIALNRPDQLRSHLALARQNGVTQEELVEVITQMAFYTGWPNAVTAIGVAREVFEQ